MAYRDDAGLLDSTTDLAIHLDNLLCDCKSSLPPYETCTSPLPPPEPMQLGCAQVSPAEKEKRKLQGLCMYCGDNNHKLS